MNTIDLHIHSYISDDEQYTEKELVDKAFQAGVKVMSITDHNSVRANKKACEYALEKGITYINGIEIDCIYNGINLHVLGLDINDKLKVFKDIEEEIHVQELSASLKRLELTKNLGFDIKLNEINKLSENGIYTCEMFGELLLNDNR
jgi:predicted metal-dependent phosphoesterase TrpH